MTRHKQQYDPFRQQKRFALLALLALGVAAVLLFALVSRAQELPAAPAPADSVGVVHGVQRDAVTGRGMLPHETRHTHAVSAGFFVVTLASAAATWADCASTNHLIQAGPQFRETSPLLGARPSPLRISLTCGGVFAGFTSVSYALKRGRRDRLWVVPQLMEMVLHGVGFGHNRTMYPHANPTMRLTRFSAITAPSR